MTLDYARLEGLISKFHWEGEGKDGDSWQLVWSAHRNSIDEDFYFDGVLRNFGHEVKLDSFSRTRLAITIGEWLYFGDKEDLEHCSNTVLLRRIRWNRLEIVDVDFDNDITTIKIMDTEES